jgi:hypothetical protein
VKVLVKLKTPKTIFPIIIPTKLIIQVTNSVNYKKIYKMFFFKYMSCKETNIFIYIHFSYVPKMYRRQIYNICLIATPVDT